MCMHRAATGYCSNGGDRTPNVMIENPHGEQLDGQATDFSFFGVVVFYKKKNELWGRCMRPKTEAVDRHTFPKTKAKKEKLENGKTTGKSIK